MVEESINETNESKTEEDITPCNRNQPNEPKGPGDLGIGQDYMDVELTDTLDNNSRSDNTLSRNNNSSLQTSVDGKRLKGFFLERDIIL